MSMRVERPSEGVALVWLDRPEAMNALSRAMRRALAETFAALAVDDSVRAIVLTGAGRAFTAGLDLRELGSDPAALGAANATEAHDNPVKAIESSGKPVIGAINGAAVTGGFEVALACDILIASTAAKFADTHARVGIMPGWGLSQKLSRLIGISRAKELSFSGNFLDAETAAAWGLVNRVVAPDQLLPVALKLASEIASVPPQAVQNYKRIIDDGFALPFGAAMAHEHATSSALNAKVTPEAVEAARGGVIARGRAQKDDPA
jgi:enoyl-CoA hydratase